MKDEHPVLVNMGPSSPRRSLHEELDSDEERKGLLSHDDKLYDEEDNSEQPSRELSRKTVARIAISLIVILLGGAIGRALLNHFRPFKVRFETQGIRNNGTHDFKKSAIIVSIDGLRADYLDRGLTPHLLEISKKGLRAKSMKPIFPFDIQFSSRTGLYAESHGIVANNFWDPESGMEFHYNRIDSAWNSSWWFGEPMWETAERAGITTANLMWPGPPKTRSGFSDVLRPVEAYEPSLDQAGHAAGPKSKLVNVRHSSLIHHNTHIRNAKQKVLKQVDRFAKDLHTSLEARNLTDIFDVVFVSDHGMTDTSSPELIFIDDILGEGFDMIEHEDGQCPASHSTPLILTFFCRLAVDGAAVLPGRGLCQVPAGPPERVRDERGAFDVYTHATMPARYHFADNERIAPIYVVPRVGYALTNRFENGTGMSKGVQPRYDNDEPSMHAMFVAHGPFPAVVKAVEQGHARSTSLVRRALGLARPNKGWHSTAEDIYVMDSFQNVEVYNLMMRLLGIECHAAKTNGTRGFWDKYF
ncbi:hypothetical protein A0H81_11168 [Grifola frondosa]|uniref:Uncharacterized protein n=1 Tax=Grifola frondosa TaxID=5627 RepID=A0A1C7LY06_GRIFR|nr:hypothetical protein A0H81_11168 [Grifola frondosa]